MASRRIGKRSQFNYFYLVVVASLLAVAHICSMNTLVKKVSESNDISSRTHLLTMPKRTKNDDEQTDKENNKEDYSTDEKQQHIFWLHIHKTGTSFFNTIYHRFCPRILLQNPFLATQKEPFSDMKLLQDYPPEEFCNNVTFANMPCPGCHFPYPEDTKDKTTGEEYFFFTMLRDPMERLRSAYSFGKHLSKLKNDSISFETYLNESHIPNCQLKMILGFQCNVFVEPEHLNISVALDRIQAPHFFFGITDRWEESICLFHYIYGGSTQPFELKNNRKTRRIETPGDINPTFAETTLFEEATRIFDMRVKEAGC